MSEGSTKLGFFDDQIALLVLFHNSSIELKHTSFAHFLDGFKCRILPETRK